MSSPKKEIKLDIQVYYRLESIGIQMNPDGAPVPPERVIKYLSENYKPEVNLGGASILKNARRRTYKGI
jgi:hypothetical protein